MRKSPGLGHYSRLPLSLESGNSKAWDWPSVDHVAGPATAELVLEVRLVNDMKTIMSEQEFRAMIGHLASVLKIPSRKLPNGWRCGRWFAIGEPPAQEPPLPDAPITAQ